MADENAARWGAWLRAELDKRGLRQVDLIDRARGELKPAIVSKWYRGETAPTIESVIAVARALDSDAAEALRASGHERAAALVARTLAEIKAEDDPILLRIRTEEALSDDEKKALEASYRRSRDELGDYFLNLLEQAIRVRRSDGQDAAAG